VSKVSDCRFSTKQFNPDDIKVLSEQIACSFQTSMLFAWLLVERTRKQLTRHQMRYLSSKLPEVGPTSTDELLNDLSSDPTVRASWLSGHVSESGLVTVKGNTKQKLKNKIILNLRKEDSSLCISIESSVYQPQLLPIGEEQPFTYAETMIKSLRIGVSEKYLLSAAWVSEAAHEFLYR
jgi:hypothetical protein